MDLHQGFVLIFGLVCLGFLELVDCEFTTGDIVEILRRLENLEKRENDQMETIKQLQEKINAQSQMKQELEETVNDQTATDSDLLETLDMENQMVQAETRENIELNAIIERQRAENNELKQLVKLFTIERHSGSLEHAENVRNENGTKLFGLPEPKGFIVSQERPVAFHAKFDHWEMKTTDIGQKLRFNIIMLNIGNGYKPTGVFRAPIGGIYFFSLSICMLHAGKEIHAELIKSGKRIAGAYANGFNQGSISVVVPLVRGDTVWVSAFNNPGTYLYGSSWNSFMGFRLAGY